jgi:hypothetical protein
MSNVFASHSAEKTAMGSLTRTLVEARAFKNEAYFLKARGISTGALMELSAPETLKESPMACLT